MRASPNLAAWRDWSCAVTVAVIEPRHLDGATRIVSELMGKVEAAASRFRADSELERVNDHAGELVPVSPLALHLVNVALDAARDTDGAVDPTIGTALIGLGYDADIATVRARTGTPAVTPQPAPGWNRVRVDRTLCRLGVPRGMRLDLGATAKAWTADEAARRILRKYGAPALVGIGGDLSAAGKHDWLVDVAEIEGGPSVRIGLTGGGLATSSLVGRRWTGPDGRPAHHVVDPRTGEPASGMWRTASIAAPSALTANVVSTWALVDDIAAGRRIRERRFPARLVDHRHDVTTWGTWPSESRAA
ncbi:FAD:protein FMN transferase [Nocardioides sp. Kera G14]|uniref:FAD:protein FMN transferase n=1 Tax=Nocardioides sp. Kera G14 TaxID=2884264 RepID=UPI001D11D1F8|nr:FAD:protein FMN transferase [Nocardioides sp. Kera G14]UDY22352.1 FAD:protein FMN transferase [Nocardioides sp. Kera G14]